MHPIKLYEKYYLFVIDRDLKCKFVLKTIDNNVKVYGGEFDICPSSIFRLAGHSIT
jgi:hypothetical protein